MLIGRLNATARWPTCGSSVARFGACDEDTKKAQCMAASGTGSVSQAAARRDVEIRAALNGQHY